MPTLPVVSLTAGLGPAHTCLSQAMQGSLLSSSLPCSEMYPARWVPPKVLPHWLVMAVLRLRGDEGCVLAPLEAAPAAQLLCSLLDGRGMHGYDCPLHFQMLCEWL